MTRVVNCRRSRRYIKSSGVGDGSDSWGMLSDVENINIRAIENESHSRTTRDRDDKCVHLIQGYKTFALYIYLFIRNMLFCITGIWMYPMVFQNFYLNVIHKDFSEVELWIRTSIYKQSRTIKTLIMKFILQDIIIYKSYILYNTNIKFMTIMKK